MCVLRVSCPCIFMYTSYVCIHTPPCAHTLCGIQKRACIEGIKAHDACMFIRHVCPLVFLRAQTETQPLKASVYAFGNHGPSVSAIRRCGRSRCHTCLVRCYVPKIERREIHPHARLDRISPRSCIRYKQYAPAILHESCQEKLKKKCREALKAGCPWEKISRTKPSQKGTSVHLRMGWTYHVTVDRKILAARSQLQKEAKK